MCVSKIEKGRKIMEYVNDFFIYLLLSIPFWLVYGHSKATKISMFNFFDLLNSIDEYRRESKKMKGKF